MTGFDAQAFRKSLIYERTAAPDDIVRDVAVLRNLDRESERRRTRWGWIGALGIVAGIALGFATGVVTESAPGLTTVWLAGAGAVFLAGVGALVYRASLGKLDTEDRRYELLARIIEMLRTDMRVGDTVAVRLDLGRPDTSSKGAGEGKIGSWKVKFFEDPWLSIGGRFADDTRFVLNVTEKFQKRSKWKTSASGKTKHKSKTKSATELLLQLKVKTKRYPALDKVRDKVASAIRLPKGAVVKRVMKDSDSLGLRVLLKGPWDCARELPETAMDGTRLVASMFLSLYQVLNLSKAITKGRPRVV